MTLENRKQVVALVRRVDDARDKSHEDVGHGVESTETQRTARSPNECAWQIIQLPDPHSGEMARYAIRGDRLLEVHKVDPSSPRSWFIGNSVQQDGSLHVMSPIDPLFILIPILDKARRKTTESDGVYLPISDLAETFPAALELCRVLSLSSVTSRIASLCDVQSCGSDILVYRLSDEKVITWLKSRVDKIVDKFESLRVLKRLSSKYTSIPSDDARLQMLVRHRIALQVIDDYLNDAWSERLSGVYDFTEVENLQKTAETTHAPGSIDYGRKASGESGEEPAAKKKKLTPAQQKLAKANTKGMKSIQSFFAKQQ